jgi:hypothetical protein
LQELDRKRIVDLPTDPSYMDVDDVIERCVSDNGLPNIACQHLARNYCASVDEKIFEEFELTHSEIDRGGAASHGAATRIHTKVSELKDCRRVGVCPPLQGSKTSEELGKGEWLYEVVVSARV